MPATSTESNLLTQENVKINMSYKCQICLNSLESSDTSCVTQICRSVCPAQVCNLCIVEYIRHQVQNTLFGVLSKLNCPICIRPVSTTRWQNLLEEECAEDSASEISLFHYRVESICQITCPRCHNADSTLPQSEVTSKTEVSLPAASNLFQLNKPFQEYMEYTMSANQFYDHITKAIEPSERMATVDQVLTYMYDSERRANLFVYLRHNINPFIYTICCQDPVCFVCKTSGHHEGSRCKAQSSEVSISEIAQCSECKLHVTKTEGCDTVVCYCGNALLWDAAVMDCKLNEFSDEQINIMKRIKAYLKHLVYKRRFDLNVGQIRSFVTQQRCARIDYILENNKFQYRERIQTFLMVFVRRQRAIRYRMKNMIVPSLIRYRYVVLLCCDPVRNAFNLWINSYHLRVQYRVVLKQLAQVSFWSYNNRVCLDEESKSLKQEAMQIMSFDDSFFTSSA